LTILPFLQYVSVRKDKTCFKPGSHISHETLKGELETYEIRSAEREYHFAVALPDDICHHLNVNPTGHRMRSSKGLFRRRSGNLATKPVIRWISSDAVYQKTGTT
jgi:hypothetical protein